MTSAAIEDDKAGSLRESAVRGGALFLAARLGTQLLQIAMTLVVVRLLQPTDYGLIATALAYIGLADILSEAGISRALVQKKELSENDLAQALTLTLLVAAVLYAILFSTAAPLGRHLGVPQFESLLKFCGAAVLLIPFGSVGAATLERKLRYGTQSVIITGSAFVQGVLVVTLALAGWGVWALAFGMFAARLVQATGTWWASGLRLRLALPGAECAGLIRFGMSITGASLLWFAYTNTDIAVISAMLGAAAAGAYSVALQVVMMPVDKVSGVVNHVSYSAYCRLQDDKPRMRDWFARLMVLRALVVMPVLIGVMLVAHDAVPLLLGEQWRPAIRLLQLLAPVACLVVVSSSFPPLINALGHPEVVFKYTLANAIVMPLAFLAGCYMGGTRGVCLAWLVTFPLLLAMLIRISRPITQIGVRDVARMLRPVMQALAVMVIVVTTIRLWFLMGLDPVPRLSICVLTGAASFIGWVWFFAPHSMRADLLQVVRDMRRKSS